ncbi:Lytic transglycosylase, catalytic [gamma proteobacterium HdN1]|nr:Hypothetical protein HDN1F_18190 [gamma proteobacterium HdN1]CBL47083.1 Lytic transglycosylase, catalytic [gamma proteobacterium HdN1]
MSTASGLRRFIGALLLTVSAYADAGVPAAYQAVASQYGVPPEVLYAIALTESRHTVSGLVRPWPWTANVEGKPYFFASRTEMSAFLTGLLRRGNRKFDVGLMQISWRHHGHRFRSVDEAIDPLTNLQAGAAYLRYLIKRRGVENAIGMYHTGEAGPMDRQRHYRKLVYASLDRIRSGRI